MADDVHLGPHPSSERLPVRAWHALLPLARTALTSRLVCVCACGRCCPKRTYSLVTPAGETLHADQKPTLCCGRLCGCLCGEGYESKVEFKGMFKTKTKVGCCRYHILNRLLCIPAYCLQACCSLTSFTTCFGDDPCGIMCPCCANLCFDHSIETQSGAQIRFISPRFCDAISHCCCPCAAVPLFASSAPPGQQSGFLVLEDRMTVIRRYPVVRWKLTAGHCVRPSFDHARSPQVPAMAAGGFGPGPRAVAWLTITSQRTSMLEGCCCCYGGFKQSSRLDIEHADNPSFETRAALMAAAIRTDEHIARRVCCAGSYNLP